jgi:hypothetical protein
MIASYENEQCHELDLATIVQICIPTTALYCGSAVEVLNCRDWTGRLGLRWPSLPACTSQVAAISCLHVLRTSGHDEPWFHMLQPMANTLRSVSVVPCFQRVIQREASVSFF